MTQDINPNTSNLCHPPFTFNLNSFESGIAAIMLKAGTSSGKIYVRASSSDLLSSEIEIISER
jgi:hypothetical protein